MEYSKFKVHINTLNNRLKHLNSITATALRDMVLINGNKYRIKDMLELLTNMQMQGHMVIIPTKILEDYVNLLFAFRPYGVNNSQFLKLALSVGVNTKRTSITNSLGVIHYNAGDYVNAIGYFKTLVDRNPFYYSSLGDSYLKLQEYKRAMDCYTKGLKWSLNSPEQVTLYHIKIIDLYTKAGNFNDAFKFIDNLLKNDNYYRIIHKRGLVMMQYAMSSGKVPFYVSKVTKMYEKLAKQLKKEDKLRALVVGDIKMLHNMFKNDNDDDDDDNDIE